MVKGLRGQQRPIEIVEAAAEIMQISATNETNYPANPPALSPAAQLGKLGGAARARILTPERRAEIAKKGAAKRWGKRQA